MIIVSNWLRLLAVAVLYAAGIFLLIQGEWMWGMLLHLAVVGSILWGTLNPSSRLFGPVQTRMENDKLWLTLDDGPDPATTPQILDLLDKRNIKATFFVIGQKADAHPELIRAIVAAGHQLANHTWSHPQGSFWCKGPWATQREIVRCQASLERTTGHPPMLFRAPVGHHNLFVHAVLKRLGMRLVGWSSRGFDGVARPLDEVMGCLKKSMAPGGIVLAHEANGIAVDVVRGIIDHAESNGWGFIDPLSYCAQQQ